MFCFTIVDRKNSQTVLVTFDFYLGFWLVPWHIQEWQKELPQFHVSQSHWMPAPILLNMYWLSWLGLMKGQRLIWLNCFQKFGCTLLLLLFFLHFTLFFYHHSYKKIWVWLIFKSQFFSLFYFKDMKVWMILYFCSQLNVLHHFLQIFS